jgi:hypothetical protein
VTMEVPKNLFVMLTAQAFLTLAFANVDIFTSAESINGETIKFSDYLGTGDGSAMLLMKLPPCLI